MAFRGRNFPRRVEHDYQGQNGWFDVPCKQYHIRNVVYSPGWPSAAFLPEPIPVIYNRHINPGTVVWQSVIQVPVIRPAFFFELRWKPFIKTPIANLTGDKWMMEGATTTGFADGKVWCADDQYGSALAGRMVPEMVCKQDPNAAYYIVRWEYGADSW
jgi:hypothetical protein